jgi:hypothetical protein
MGRPEDKYVKIPALVHATRIGYSYASIHGKEPGVDYDGDTHIFYEAFRTSISRINGRGIDEQRARYLAGQLRLKLSADDLGKAFFTCLQTGIEGYRILDFENPENNSFQVVTGASLRERGGQLPPRHHFSRKWHAARFHGGQAPEQQGWHPVRARAYVPQVQQPRHRIRTVRQPETRRVADARHRRGDRPGNRGSDHPEKAKSEKSLALQSCIVETLSKVGCKVVVSNAPLTGIAIFDGKITWYGTLPLLAFAKADDCSLRVEGAEVAADLEKALEASIAT